MEFYTNREQRAMIARSDNDREVWYAVSKNITAPNTWDAFRMHKHTHQILIGDCYESVDEALQACLTFDESLAMPDSLPDYEIMRDKRGYNLRVKSPCLDY